MNEFDRLFNRYVEEQKRSATGQRLETRSDRNEEDVRGRSLADLEVV